MFFVIDGILSWKASISFFFFSPVTSQSKTRGGHLLEISLKLSGTKNIVGESTYEVDWTWREMKVNRRKREHSR